VAHRPLSGVLLIGGASRRFGSPKALARVGDTTLAARAWDLLGGVCAERIAVGKAEDRLALPFPVVDDGAAVRAPLAGVVAGLRAASHELCVVVPVDVPRLTAAALIELADACLDAAVPQTGPLPAALQRRVLPALERRLAGGRLALHEALAELDTRVVHLDPELLVNVNTTGDLARVGGRP
jgi:molybdopterin-guanine dinucleotide biosynthesis protein A